MRREEEEIFEEDDDDKSLEDGPVFEGARLAYIKPINLEEARAMGLVIPSEIKLPANVKLFALHAADGTTFRNHRQLGGRLQCRRSEQFRTA